MSSLGLNIGLQSLLTAQAALDTIGHNVANANTPGYSRQNLHVSTGESLSLRGIIQGTGVRADVVQRTVDALLKGRLERQTSTLGRLDSRLATMWQAETFLGTQSGTGVDALLQGFFGSLSTLSTAPEDPALRNGAVQSASHFANRMVELANNTESLRRETVQRLDASIGQVNQLAREIGDLNRQITSTESEVYRANDLRDRRDQATRELASFVDVRSIEDERGAVRILVGGAMLVSPTSVQEMELVNDPATGDVNIRISGHVKPIAVSGGAIGGLLGALDSFIPKLGQDVDSFARAVILETNRVHSTGMGADGPFRMLQGTSVPTDVNGNGDLTDELLSAAGLPFDVVSGELYVNLTDDAAGEMTKHRIPIDAARTTTGDLMDALNAIEHLSASVDTDGRMRISADPGFGFDFSRRLDATPDEVGSFGGGRATLTSSSAGPFALTSGATLNVNGPLGAFAVTFDPTAFAQVNQATAAEVVAVINADPNVQANGMVASVVGEHLVLQSAGAGSGESFDITGGTALGAFGWSAGTTVTGQDDQVDVTIGGEYAGDQNGVYTFRPNIDGTIGTTAGLKIQVFDASGTQITELDVGPGYSPGDELEVAEGVTARFGFGGISASTGDVFVVDVVADADTADVLPALGINGLFTGSDAATIAVREDLLRDPSLLAGSVSGAGGDGSNLLALLQLEGTDVGGLGSVSFSEGWADLVGDVALEISAAANATESETFLMDSLEQRRDQMSGVNVDEEMVHLIEQEQAFTAASQYIRVISELTNELMNLI